MAEGIAGAWETAEQPFDGWSGERWEFDVDGTGRVVSAGILITAGIVEFAWEPVDAGRLRIRLDGDQWREVAYTVEAGEDGRETLTEVASTGFCGSDGPLVRAGAWSEN